jgi:hypothetical protein
MYKRIVSTLVAIAQTKTIVEDSMRNQRFGGSPALHLSRYAVKSCIHIAKKCQFGAALHARNSGGQTQAVSTLETAH